MMTAKQVKAKTSNAERPMSSSEAAMALEFRIGRWALGVRRFLPYGSEGKRGAPHRRPRLDCKSIFQHADPDARSDDSPPRRFRGSGLLLLERRTKPARRPPLLPRTGNPRSLRRAKFHQRRLFH